MQLPLAVQTYGRKTDGIPYHECVNWYAEPSTTPGQRFDLHPCPGLTPFAALSTGPVRGLFRSDGVFGGQAFAVSGGLLYSVTRDGTPTELGEVPGTGRVQFAASNSQLAICADGRGFVLTDDGLSAITDPDFPPVSSVQYANGYFLWTRRDTGQVIHSRVLDGTDYDALDFVTAESAPDNALGLIVDHSQLFVFGSETIQPFSASTNPNAPFVPLPSSVIEKGTVSRDSVAKADNTIFFVGDDLIVYRLNGLSPLRISTFGIEAMLETLDDFEQGVVSAWTYAQGGHTFYVLDIPGHGTFAYDIATQTWHERRGWRTELLPVHVTERMFGRIIVGSRLDGSLYVLDRDAPTYDQDFIERLVTGGVPVSDGRPDLIHVALDVSSRVGTLDGEGRDPEVMLETSDDMGTTWGRVRKTNLPAIGDYRCQPKWTRFRKMEPPGRMFRFRSTDPVAYVVRGARLNVRKP